jgi:predicted nucleic acid-binding Zn ribbon protein
MEEIGKTLPKVLQTQLSRLEPPVVEILAPLWAHVAGKGLAKECRPVAFSSGTLTLATEDPDWAEPLQQMAEEIRAHVNNFLGKPVVRHLRILSVRKLARGGKSQQQLEDLSVSESKRRDWPRWGPGMPSVAPEVIGHSRVKYSSRKRAKVQ